MLKKIIPMLVALVLVLPSWSGAENLTVQGEMGSVIRLEMDRHVTSAPGVHRMVLSFVVPEAFRSPTCAQSIEGFDLHFSPVPESEKSWRDNRGNRIIMASWKSPPESIDVHLAFQAESTTQLAVLDTTAPFPLAPVPAEAKAYLVATKQVQANEQRIRDLSEEIVRGASSEFDAVQRVLTFLIDYLHYVTPPAQYDALYSLENGKGNCQNYSHLSAALLRAAGIPVRIVNGITLDKPINVSREDGVITFKMGQGRHSWIEVWFPDLGWVPFDPQQTAMFVPNRFIRIEVGIDNDETSNDGLLRWFQLRRAGPEPAVREIIRADFVDDKVRMNGRREATGPRNYLLLPGVNAQVQQRPTEVAETHAAWSSSSFWLFVTDAYSPVAGVTPSLPPFFVSPPEKTRVRFLAERDEKEEITTLPEEGPVLFGNLDFPADIDFTFPPVATITAGEGDYMKPKSFFVETAEYVTSQRTQYAQVFELSRPLQLQRIALALHKYGGDGQLWVDLYRDEEGKPGAVIAASELVDLSTLAEKPGYRWTEFPFAAGLPSLAPGRYWIGLGFTGSPIVNWFYTYGKPIGPPDGTRYKGIFDSDWSGALGYEFNYRVAGIVVKQPEADTAAPVPLAASGI